MFKRTILVALVSSIFGTSAFAETSRIAVGNGFKLPEAVIFDNSKFKKQLPHIRPEYLKPQCPDLAVTMSQRDLGSHGIEIRYSVKNVGRYAYRSDPNQQALVLRDAGRSLRNHPFANLAPGAFADYTIMYRPRPDAEFPQFYEAFISLDPDIGYDSNEANDDCKPHNNQASLWTVR